MTWYALYGSPVSDNYHSEGSVVVWAADEDEARGIATEWSIKNIEDDEGESPEWHQVRELDPMQVYSFPDAGCC